MNIVKIKSIILFVFFANQCFGQNLVLNPSFENYCGKYPCNWFEISGTPDIYTKNKLHISYRLHIYNDFLGATKGKVFVGLGSVHTKAGEGIQGTLKQKLDSNRLYNIKMYAMSYHFCNGGFRSIRVCLTDTLLNKTVQPFEYKLKSIDLYAKDSAIINSRETWVELSSNYFAKGNEKYIYITGQTDTLKSALKMGCIMKYFDSVIVEPTSIFLNKPITIDSIFFETGKAIISPLSFPKLYNLVLVLNQNLYSKIKINGHTDNIGLPSTNMLLSQKRAQVVVNYLISKGVSKNKLIAIGFGSTKPIADNLTEDGKAKNRRIEFEFTD
jgi:OOP family OmpA-OmpF porin